MLLNYHICRLVLSSLCVGDLVRLVLGGARFAGFNLQNEHHQISTAAKTPTHNEGTEKDNEIAPVLPSLQMAQYTTFGNGAQPVKKCTRSESKKTIENDLLSKNNLAEHSNTSLLTLTFCFFPFGRERERERERERDREREGALIETSEPSLILK